MIFRGSVLLFALLFNARIVWQALGEQTVSLQTATIHFLITVPVVAVLFGLFRMATRRPRYWSATPRAIRANASNRCGLSRGRISFGPGRPSPPIDALDTPSVRAAK